MLIPKKILFLGIDGKGSTAESYERTLGHSVPTRQTEDLIVGFLLAPAKELG